ncbi:MAG: glycerophosphodiester phosphodiesterase family protein [Candidatus Heimdallarchaeota archaeon]|nr:glycerophosphodiester phosphodiesterase family protein [Candidatus Heimdallarchaeota archaeon]MDH5644849.1 glycerophosphodiester phosphodiesterase family protein [Candidatus Heimdallarchaeota archaeon]
MICIAHRGASGIAPENTSLSVWTAIESNADMIEIDIQITKDNELVLFHDKELARITTGKGGIIDYTIKQLKRKDIGKWKDKSFAKMRITTFEELLMEIPSKTSLVVEVKPQPKQNIEERVLERKIIDLLDSYNGIGNGYISVRDIPTYSWFIENTSKYTIGLMQKKRTPSEMLELVKLHKIKVSQIRWRNYGAIDYKKLKQTGSKIMAFYGDIPDDWDLLILNQVDGILTNYPALLSGYLAMKGIK